MLATFLIIFLSLVCLGVFAIARQSHALGLFPERWRRSTPFDRHIFTDYKQDLTVNAGHDVYK